MISNPDFFLLSEECLLISWKGNPSEELAAAIHGLSDRMLESWPNKVKETVPANVSIALIFDPNLISHLELQNSIAKMIAHDEMKTSRSAKKWEIPICYADSESADIKMVMEKTGLAFKEIIRMHSTSDFWLNMIGFLPGFVYLSGLPKELHIPRKTTPSKRVETGSVAIAGTQSGIYPQNSPGGWYVLGKTPLPMFDASSNPPTFAQVGDRISFTSISQSEFQQIKEAIERNGLMWNLEQDKYRIKGIDS